MSLVSCWPTSRLHPEPGSRVSSLALLTFGARSFSAGTLPCPVGCLAVSLASTHYPWVETPPSLSWDN